MTSAMLCLLLANGFLGGFFAAAALEIWIEGQSFRVCALCSMFNSASAVLGMVLLWP